MEGNGYQVTWTFGHLCTLKEPNDYTDNWKRWSLGALPMIPQRFGIKLIEDRGIEKQFQVIERLMQNADEIVNCGDAGQEGELIQRWVMQKAQAKCPVKRLWISSLTEEAIRQGFANLKDQSEYQPLYLAGLSRAIGDWILGMNATRLYTLKYGQNRQVLSIGRVQTPTLALIVNRQKEIDNFKPEAYWVLSTIYRDTLFTATKGKFTNKEEGERAFATIADKDFEITGVVKKKGTEAPPHLFDLTSLQVECNRKFGYSAETTLNLIQSLYEKKLTTYPRVDTQYLSDDIYPKCPLILKGVRGYETFTQPLLGKALNKSKKVFDSSKVTDHHAIIPTGETPSGLSADEATVYQMVVNRFVEAFSPDSEEERMQVRFTDGTNTFTWKAYRQISLGWKAVQKGKEAEADKKEDDDEQFLSSLPNLPEGEVLPLVNAEITEHKTKPKPLYTEATLLSAMENAGKEVKDAESKKAMAACGIGTPATRANIIETLILRDYIRRDKKAIIPTEKGLAVYEIVKDKKIANAEMTGSWELALAAIEAGKMPSERFAQGINSYVETICEELLSLTPEQKSYPVYRCPKCGQQSVGIYAKVAKCRHETCGFHVFREVCGIHLSEDNIRDLIGSGRTPILKGLTSKAGKKFNARLVLKDDYTTTFEFEQNKKRK